MKTILEVREVKKGFIFAIIVCIIFGLYPARKTSKLNPVEACDMNRCLARFILRKGFSAW